MTTATAFATAPLTELLAPSPDAAKPAAGDPCPLRTVRLTKSFRQGRNSVTALRDVSLDVSRAEFVAVMGASGSGKSTLLHLLAGLTRPDEGSVFIDGHELTALKDPELTKFRRRHIGLVFQSFNLIPTLTALDNVGMPVMAGGDPGSFSAEELLERVGLKDRMTHRPDALSGGEQQRVAIARALISDPSVVLADEPTGSLDSATGRTICELLRELKESHGRTIVAVTHEPADADWADRVIVLKDGGVLTEFATADFDDSLQLAAHYQEVISTARS